METDRWLLIKKIFKEVSGLPPDKRSAFLDKACGNEGELRTEIEALLQADSNAEEFMETPPASDPPDAEALIDAQIGQYKLKRIISSGGMGTVFEAQQEHPNRTVAVKVMRSGIATRSAQRRFEYESEILAHLRHPHIAQVIEAGTHDGVPYFVMEYIPDALSITRFARTRDLGTRKRLELYLHVCEAVHHGHQKGIIHRDLKPSNILVDASGQVKIIDFGVARATDSDVSLTTVQTEVGQLIGTLQYMSPEQCKADPADLDIRSDVYALGVVLYELLCNELPYDVRKTAMFEAARLIREEPPRRPSTINRHLRGDVETIVLKALEKEREDRYPSVSDFSEDLERYLSGEVILAKPTGPLVRLWKGVKRNPVVSGSIAAAFIALVASFLYVVLVAYPQIRLERDKAKAAAVTAQEERDRATRAAEIAQATNDFLDEMLSSPDPYHQGKDVTMVEVLDIASTKLGTAYTDIPEVEARLRGTLGNTYFFLGAYKKSVEQLLRSVELFEGFSGKESLLSNKARSVLASVYTAQGRLDEAEALLTHALEESLRQTDEVHPITSLIMKFMADLTYERGRFVEAEKLYDKVAKAHVELFGPEHPDTLSAMNNLARIKRDRGMTEEALELQRNILEVRRRTLGEEHLQTLFSMTSLANTLLVLKQVEEASELSKKAFQSISRLLGEDHPFTLTVMNNMADMMERQHHLDEAESIYRDLLKFRLELLGERHPDTLQVIYNIADVLWKQNKLDEAETLHRKALAIRTETLGEDHPDTLYSRSGLGKLLGTQGRLAESETILREVLEDRIRVLGEDHHTTHDSYHHLARLLTDRGKISEAMDITETLLEKEMTRLGEESSATLTTMENLAILLDRSGKAPEAEELFARLLEIRRSVRGEAHEQTLKAMHNLVIFYENHGEIERMEALSRELFDLWKRFHDPEHVDTMKAMNNLIRALMRQKRFEEAVPLLEGGMEIMERLWPKHGIRGMLLLEYGECMIRLRRYKEAEQHLKQGLEQWTELFGEGHWRLDTAVNLLIELYEIWGKIDEAEKWRGKIVNPSDA